MSETTAAKPCTHCNGTGTEPELPDAEAVRAYMRTTGWAPRPDAGPAGVLWHHPAARHEIAVWFEMKPGSLEWRGVVVRLARFESRTVDEVLSAIGELAASDVIPPARHSHRFKPIFGAMVCSCGETVS